MQAVAALRNQFGGHATVGRDEDVEAPGSPEPPSRRMADRAAAPAELGDGADPRSDADESGSPARDGEGGGGGHGDRPGS